MAFWLVNSSPYLKAEANLNERRALQFTILDAVHVDAKETKSIVSTGPKPPFIPIFKVAVSRKGSDIRILNGPLDSSSKVSSVFVVKT